MKKVFKMHEIFSVVVNDISKDIMELQKKSQKEKKYRKKIDKLERNFKKFGLKRR